MVERKMIRPTISQATKSLSALCYQPLAPEAIMPVIMPMGLTWKVAQLLGAGQGQ